MRSPNMIKSRDFYQSHCMGSAKKIAARPRAEGVAHKVRLKPAPTVKARLPADSDPLP